MRKHLFLVLAAALFAACGPPPGTISKRHTGILEETDQKHEGQPADTYTFEAHKGDKVELQMTGRDVDPAMILLDSSSNELARNDDVSGRLRHSVITFVPDEDDTFTIVATRGGAGGTGEYEVEIEIVPAASR